MNISPNTVKGFLKLIMMKLGVSTRSDVIGKAVSPARQGGYRANRQPTLRVPFRW